METVNESVMKCKNCDQLYDGTECKNPNKHMAVAPCPFEVPQQPHQPLDEGVEEV